MKVKYSNFSNIIFFQEGSIDVYEKLWQKMQKRKIQSIQDDYQVAFANVVNENKHAFAIDKTLLQTEMDKCSNCDDLIVLFEEFNKIGMGLVIRNNMPYKKKMDQM